MGVQDEVEDTTSGSTGQSPNAFIPKKATTKKLLSIMAFAVLVVLIGLVVYFVSHNEKEAKTPVTPKQKFEAAYNEVQNLSGQSKYDETAKAAVAYVAANPPTNQAAKDYDKQLTVLAGTAYLNDKNYAKALEYYKQSLALSTDSFDKMSAMHGIAMTYQRSGEKEKAIAEYKAIIEIARPMSADNQQAARFIVRDERAITALGGQL